MKKLLNVIEKTYNTGCLPRGCSVADFRTLETIYYEIKDGKKPCFIQSAVNKILNICGIKTAVYGTGWRVL